MVNVTTDLAITGKPAQFGRGVMVEVGNKLLGRFADCLAEEIGIGSPGDSAAPADEGLRTRRGATAQHAWRCGRPGLRTRPALRATSWPRLRAATQW